MARRLPPLNALRAFEAAARHGSLTEAARELSVTPAAVSHQVRALEEDLGIELFRRLPRGLVLTDRGRALLPGLSEGFARLARAAEAVRESRPAGRLVVSVLPSFAAGWLMTRLPRFLARFPEVDLTVRSEVKWVDFGREDVDAAIRYGRGDFPGLHVESLMAEEVFPVCSPALLNGPRPLRDWPDLAGHILLHDAAPSPHEPWITWTPWLKAHGLDAVDPGRGPGFTDSTLLVLAAVAGMGVAVGRSGLLGDHLAAGRLVRPFGAPRVTDSAYWLVAPEAALDNAKVRAFFDWMKEEAASP